jgi:hypothetical protein
MRQLPNLANIFGSSPPLLCQAERQCPGRRRELAILAISGGWRTALFLDSAVVNNENIGMTNRNCLERSLRLEPLEQRTLLSVQAAAGPPAFAITAPTSGTYYAGDDVTIQWTASNVTLNSKISLCYDRDTTWNNGNERWIEIDAVTAANGSGFYTWNTSKVQVGTYFIAGYMFDGANTFILSHLTQSITIKSNAPAFALTSPASGTFTVGDDVSIKWTAGNVKAGSTISLCYDKDATWNNGNETWIEIDHVAAANGNGSYSWDTASVPAGTYYVAGYMWDGASTFSPSHMLQPITITVAPPSPSFALSAPTSGAFPAGATIDVQWTAANVVAGSKISLCYDEDATWSNGNEHWIEIDGVTAADGGSSYAWHTTGVQPGTYYVAGYMWDGGNDFILSHLTEAIEITAAAPPSFVLSAPTSGQYQAGDQVSIQWTAGGVAAGSKISLCYDEDALWTGDNQHWIEIDGVTAADGGDSYAWNTTGVAPGTYYVAGYMWDGGDTFTLSHLTQSITIAAVQPLTLASSAVKPATAGALVADELAPIVAEAKSRLVAALGARVSTALDDASFEIADLPGGLLGETSGKTIRIDRDAAGYGWFVDPTPGDDAEFAAPAASRALTASKGGPADNRADLLTTVMHEMGHELGLVHDDLADLMSATLPLGVRQTFITPTPGPFLS